MKKELVYEPVGYEEYDWIDDSYCEAALKFIESYDIDDIEYCIIYFDRNEDSRDNIDNFL